MDPCLAGVIWDMTNFKFWGWILSLDMCQHDTCF